jgi:hypothetical protein
MENFEYDDEFSRENIFSRKNVRYSDDEEESESEYEFDEKSDCSENFNMNDDEDIQVLEAFREKIQKEKDLKQLEGIFVLKPKLNWLEKKENLENKDFLPDENLYPSLGNKSKSKKNSKNSKSGGFLFPPNSSIKVIIGPRTFIEFAPVPCKLFSLGKCEKGEECDYFHPRPTQPCKFGQNCKNSNCKFLHEENTEILQNPISKPICKYFLAGQCKYENNCKFSHEKIEQKIKPICKFFLSGQICKYENTCKFSHEVVVPKKVRTLCRNGINCSNKKCTFFHPKSENENFSNEVEQKLVEKEPKMTTDEKKFVLCRNMFKVSESIEKIGECSFGNKCRFSHSWQEVRDFIENSDFKCMFEEKFKKCRGVVVEKQQKVIGEKTKTILRYKNAVEHKCFKIHKMERVKDFIIRTQSKF